METVYRFLGLLTCYWSYFKILQNMLPKSVRFSCKRPMFGKYAIWSQGITVLFIMHLKVLLGVPKVEYWVLINRLSGGSYEILTITPRALEQLWSILAQHQIHNFLCYSNFYFFCILKIMWPQLLLKLLLRWGHRNTDTRRGSSALPPLIY